MRVTYKSEGGLAYLPALQKPIDIDVDQLAPPERNEFARLVQEALFFELPETIGSAAKGAADYSVDILTVQHEGRSHSVRVLSAPPQGPLQELLRAVRAKVKDIRARSRNG